MACWTRGPIAVGSGGTPDSRRQPKPWSADHISRAQASHISTPTQWQPQNCHFCGPCYTRVQRLHGSATHDYATAHCQLPKPRGGHVGLSQPRPADATTHLRNVMGRLLSLPLICARENLRKTPNRKMQHLQHRRRRSLRPTKLKKKKRPHPPRRPRHRPRQAP